MAGMGAETPEHLQIYEQATGQKIDPFHPEAISSMITDPQTGQLLSVNAAREALRARGVPHDQIERELQQRYGPNYRRPLGPPAPYPQFAPNTSPLALPPLKPLFSR
jgi:hypothetical protein